MSAPSTDRPATGTGPQSLRDAWPALAGLAAVFLFEMLDNSILNVALPTIGHDLRASTTALQWVTGAYSVVFGGLMLAFGAIADRFGRRRVMLVGLTLLGVASLATAFVGSAAQLIGVRVVMGVAAAMTTPGSMALAFRLFDSDRLRVRALTLISTIGMIGLAFGPTAGGLVLAVAPWQVLLLVNVPIAVLAILGIRAGITRDDAAGLHRDPVDWPGAILGTATVVLALLSPTLFVDEGTGSPLPWLTAGAALAAVVLFVRRQLSARHPLLDLKLVARPLVSSGLAYKAAAGLATGGLGYLVTLQLQLAWGWTPTLAALGLLPQVIVLLAGGRFVDPFVQRVGIERAAWLSAAAVVLGLAVYAVMNSHGYVWIAVALAIEAAGMRVVGAVAGVNVLRGLPKNRSTIGAALVDTATEVTSAVGIAVTGTILAALFTGSIATPHWSVQQSGQFQSAATVSGLSLTFVAAALVGWAVNRMRGAAQPAEAGAA
ncbi:MFS transporter [Amycolatopsis sp. PS_44_ISF1]|uniref:MFS transporter n=1 Tax=Amycolatopsis sp. PS_44_ISF1 TaxID=2974917 RepID=UPI0028DDFD1E|nr:MFS transporter [Amycolatopsis sp. PS_44_ISF1]MDT8911112.1 MFS transporter [Amycolatopsis sp. PS_44_ISF1]